MPFCRSWGLLGNGETRFEQAGLLPTIAKEVMNDLGEAFLRLLV
jgi:hypothetical protein